MGHLERPRRIVQPGGAGTPPSTSSDALRRTDQGLTTSGGARRTVGAPGPAAPLRRERLAPRPQGLRDAVGRLDAGLEEQARRQLAQWIGEEYQASYGEVPLGFFARCYLGPPYVDHQLNLFQVIIRHFAPSDPVPEPFAGARMLVRSGGYAFVEVYSGGLLLPVLDDGTVVRP
ncbi:hypothetical protein SSP24_34180 [Streptomyces spinoverrucosus]|uniref:Uncharacterized protein n=1 Tax=Streptomyces spinoverrucosus TaxID=284043 RepID=A0A4Y3VH00_9ACTN|nr:hypothetical protein [Streptomyces spinoverrucosus]GEC05763.1 hypothetical protein SSP24_34180 [Streptomyces spinoverrucosus]GHB82786.1 hypothetical protein GCM10010397_62520 [Streptomyces spinoverrucosus]